MTLMIGQERNDGTDIDSKHIRSITRVVGSLDSTGRALEVMDEDGLDFLPVVEADTGKLLGVVLRKGIERGCRGMNHDPGTCPVQNHLKTDVRFSFADTTLDPEVVDAAVREPIVVVDRQFRPTGILQGEAAR